MDIFEKRFAYKPFEYNQFQEIIDAMNQTYWVHSEIDFTGDIQDFKTDLTPEEQDILKKTLLAISQIEVSVKTFWGDLYRHMPKPEINNLGTTLAESEVRHSEAYSRLLTVLGLESEFNELFNTPVINNRINALEGILSCSKAKVVDKKKYVKSLLMFSILIENVSLFSQFAIVLSFVRFKGKMSNIANMISYTIIEEDLHARAGIELIKIIRKENPDYFDDHFLKSIRDDVEKSLEVESEIVSWIYEVGELKDLSKEELTNFMKYRVDTLLKELDIEPVFGEHGKNLSWFEEESYAHTNDDFFAKRPTAYTKHNKPITTAELF